MSSIATYVGIDVSKDNLDIKVPGMKHIRVHNTPEGLHSLLGYLSQEAIVQLECSGGHERLAINLLRKAGIEVRLLNAYRTKQTARGTGQIAKTDKLDAKFLSEGCDRIPASGVKSESKQALCDLSRFIQQKKSDVANAKKRRLVPGLDELVRAALGREIAFLESEVKRLEAEFLRRVKASEYAEAYKLIGSVPHIGPVTARVLVTELSDDLDRFKPTQVTSYAGLAPLDNSSGLRIGHKNIGRGNVRIKAALYLPALGCMCTQVWAQELRDRLRAKGKSHQTIAVAVMRRLLLRVVAVLKRGSSWQEDPPGC